MAEDFAAYAAPEAPQVTSLDVRLICHEVDGENEYQAIYHFDVVDAEGGVLKSRSGGLMPYLTAAQITAAKALMDALLAKAQGVVE